MSAHLSSNGSLQRLKGSIRQRRPFAVAVAYEVRPTDKPEFIVWRQRQDPEPDGTVRDCEDPEIILECIQR